MPLSRPFLNGANYLDRCARVVHEDHLGHVVLNPAAIVQMTALSRVDQKVDERERRPFCAFKRGVMLWS